MRLGVLGTMVWDRIDHPDVDRVERWGGISYSLAAAAAALPDGWELRPLIRVGRDLLDQARSFLDTVPGLERPGGVEPVPEPNNRVHLRYQDRHHRLERLTGGVSPWQWHDLAPHLEGLDGLYVNLISGFELDLAVARRLRDAIAGPVFADLHSLLLGVDHDGHRTPRRLQDREAWLAAFDVVQLNTRELQLLADDDDPRDLIARALAGRVHAVLETRGPAGAAWFSQTDGADAPLGSGADAGSLDRARRPIQSGMVPVREPRSSGDPTGCGDVWGATCFVHLVRGDRLEAAMAAANRAAARNVTHRGAEGLYEHLRKAS